MTEPVGQSGFVVAFQKDDSASGGLPDKDFSCRFGCGRKHAGSRFPVPR
ncbi:hypothetical protein GbCGDNIH6_5075 [Granulibacter bethesdensis]|nr:hypothetical protein GbCGDNIH6_5075 [Granulibacter bethesdensis]